MIRFQQIDKKKQNGENFISMVIFNKSIVRNKKSNNQSQYSPFKDDFALFYLSLLVGLKLNLKKNTNDYDLKEMTDEWTQELNEGSNAKDYIIALFLSRKIKDYKNDKSKIQEIMNKTLDSKRRSSLSSDGLKELHEYCFGGYEKILEECGNQTPSSIVVFLNKIKTILK